jgi:hypothetical protein
MIEPGLVRMLRSVHHRAARCAMNISVAVSLGLWCGVVVALLNLLL